MWGVIAAVVILLVAAAIILPRLINPGVPTSEPKATLTEPATEPALTTLESTPIPVFASDNPDVVFDADHTEEGLILHSGDDFDIEEISVSGETAWRTGNGLILPSVDDNKMADFYMEFKITSRALYYIPIGRIVRIEVQYLDEGTDVFAIHYDGRTGGPYGDGRFKLTDAIQKTDSGKFKTAVFELTDALFIHRNNNADFRIDDYGDGAETIRRVRVRLLPE